GQRDRVQAEQGNELGGIADLDRRVLDAAGSGFSAPAQLNSEFHQAPIMLLIEKSGSSQGDRAGASLVLMATAGAIALIKASMPSILFGLILLSLIGRMVSSRRRSTTAFEAIQVITGLPSWRSRVGPAFTRASSSLAGSVTAEAFL